MSAAPRALTRRRLLALLAAAGAGAGVAGCTRNTPTAAAPDPLPPAPPAGPASPVAPGAALRAGTAAASPAADGAPPPARARAAPPPPPPAPPPYEPLPREVLPEAKRIAARAAQQLTTYPAGQPWEQVVQTALAGEEVGEPDAVAVATAPLHREGAASAGEVVYAQLGGLQRGAGGDRAAVLVVVRQVVRLPEGEVAHTRSVDVRVRSDRGGWRLEGFGDVGGEPLPRPPSLPAAAVAVLEHRRIDLSDSARWDVHAGGVDERLLQVMLAMAEESAYSVTCLRSGHPLSVFGTSRPSNHTSGRAADIWAVEGVPVVAQLAEGSPAHRLARWLFDAGLPELGAPWAFDGYGGRSFTNTVHRDHLHVAFEDR